MAEGIMTKCDFCSKRALYDGKTKFGPWGYMCEEHFALLGINEPGMFAELRERKKPEFKECRVCHRMLPVDEFYTYTDHSGITRYRTECKECNLKSRKAGTDNE